MVDILHPGNHPFFLPSSSSVVYNEDGESIIHDDITSLFSTLPHQQIQSPLQYHQPLLTPPLVLGPRTNVNSSQNSNRYTQFTTTNRRLTSLLIEEDEEIDDDDEEEEEGDEDDSSISDSDSENGVNDHVSIIAASDSGSGSGSDSESDNSARKRKRSSDDEDDHNSSSNSSDEDDEDDESERAGKRSATAATTITNTTATTTGIDLPNIFASLRQFLNEPLLEPIGTPKRSFVCYNKSLTTLYTMLETYLQESRDLSYYRIGYTYHITCMMNRYGTGSSSNNSGTCNLQATIYRPQHIDEQFAHQYVIVIEWINGDSLLCDEIYQEMKDVLQESERDTNTLFDSYGFYNSTNMGDMNVLAHGISSLGYRQPDSGVKALKETDE